MTDVVHRAAVGAVVALAMSRALTARPPGGALRWQRTNHRGATVSLLSGPALAVAAATTGRGSALRLAVIGSGLVGAYDDAHDDARGAKGFAGHLSALRRGRITGGAVKVAGVSCTGALAALCLRPRQPVDVLLAGAVIAGAANAMNLLDLRPGRALKVGLVTAVVLGEPGLAGTCAALLPADLDERAMLGDAGANALGAALGAALVSRVQSRSLRATALAGLVALTAASEVVSFSAVIDRSPVLGRLDRLGRRP